MANKRFEEFKRGFGFKVRDEKKAKPKPKGRMASAFLVRPKKKGSAFLVRPKKK